MLNAKGDFSAVVELFESHAVPRNRETTAEYVAALLQSGRLTPQDAARVLSEGLRAVETQLPLGAHRSAANGGEWASRADRTSAPWWQAMAGPAEAQPAQSRPWASFRSFLPSSSAPSVPPGANPAATMEAASTGAATLAAAGQLGTRASPVVVQMAEPSLGASAWKTVRSVASLVLMLSFLSVVIDERAGGGMLKGMMQSPEASPKTGTPTRFADVKGVDEAKSELEEIVEYLKDPVRFTRLGGRLPRGVLLVGPPGTGKTMLARAVAGEAGVPFFYASGSEFEEMFVGVGARRVRDLFAAARKQAPCIVFIDEIDAIGGRRNPRDQQYARMTLNQLLVELDGFKAQEGIIVVAATNFPESLDRALVRPGRFDRNVYVPLPDVMGRKQILEAHARKVRLANGTDMTAIAKGTSGMSGADLANVVNLAALKAARDGLETVDSNDLEFAKERIRFGTEQRSRVIPDDQKRLVAFHEGGHALVSLYTAGAHPLHKATIIPRGTAGGMTMFLPDDSRTLTSRKQLMAQLDVSLGGRVAEELVFGEAETTTGAWDDLRKATQQAMAMVTQFGFSERLGYVHFKEEDLKSLSDKEKETIDAETRRLVQGAYERAKKLLSEHRAELNALAQELQDKETLTAEQIRAVCVRAGGSPPEAPQAA